MKSTSPIRYTCVYYAIDANNTYKVLIILSFIKEAIIFDDNTIKYNTHDILIKRIYLISSTLSLLKLIKFIKFNKFIKIT